MGNLIVVALENQKTADYARGLLTEALGEDIVVLDNPSTADLGVSRSVGTPDSRLRRWIRLPVRATSIALAGTFTAMAWTGLIVGGLAGELANRLADLRDENAFPKNVQQAVQSKDTTLVLIVDEDLTEELKEQLRQLHGRVWRTPLSEEQEAKLRSSIARS